MITYQQFRSEATLRAEHAAWLRSSIGQIVIAVLREGARARDVPTGADALASARYLSQLSGYQSCLDDLVSLAWPPEEANKTPEADFAGQTPIPEYGDQQPPQNWYAEMDAR